MSDELHMPLKFGEAGPEIQRLREENQHIRGAHEDCRAQWTQMATHNAEQAAEITRLRDKVDAASRVLHKAGEQFTFYANQHSAKGTADGDEKAVTNKQWAQRCFNAYDVALEGKKA